MPNTSGVHVGKVVFSDLDYADDIALLVPQYDELGLRLERFRPACRSTQARRVPDDDVG